MCFLGVRIFEREREREHLAAVKTVKAAAFGSAAPYNVVYTDVSGERAASLFRDPEIASPVFSETSVCDRLYGVTRQVLTIFTIDTLVSM
jgi:hypothetical protein